MPSYPHWDYTQQDLGHQYRATVPWPYQGLEQLDWIIGIHSIEQWLAKHGMVKHSDWQWCMPTESWYLDLKFRLADHCTLFLLRWG